MRCDLGIWVADEVAKESDEPEVVLTGCIATDDRTNERPRASLSSPSPSSSPTTKETKKKITAGGPNPPLVPLLPIYLLT